MEEIWTWREKRIYVVFLLRAYSATKADLDFKFIVYEVASKLFWTKIEYDSIQK